MNRVRTLIAAALVTMPVLSLSAATPSDTLSGASPLDLSTQVMRDSPLPMPKTDYCVYWLGQIFCF